MPSSTTARRALHLLIPFASVRSAAATQAASGLSLPRLERLLGRLSATRLDAGEELSLNAPHERALAHELGWPLQDGLLPLATRLAQADGLDTGPAGTGWGLLSPTHWHVGTEQVSLTDPATLDLDEVDARALFEVVQTLFADDGWRLLWGHRHRWYASHPSLATLPTASLDRVVGRNVDLWLTMHPQAGAIRRLQAEVQMLLHTHPVNAAREARGLLPVNSFWLSGTGPAAGPGGGPTEVPGASPDGPPRAPGSLVIADDLRGPALAEDWAAWAEAWAALDSGPVADWLARAEAGEPVSLSLSGERAVQCYTQRPRPWWQRGWLQPRADPATELARL